MKKIVQRAIFAICTAMMLLGGSSNVFGQFGHSDVDFGYEDGRIVTDRSVYPAGFPTSGIAKQFSSNPGFASETDGGGGIGSDDEVVYHVLGDLMFWAEGQFSTPGDAQIRIQNNPPSVPPTMVNGDSGRQDGEFDPPRNRIGSASSSGEVHSHVNFFLETDSGETPESGSYGLELSLASDREGVEESLPFYFVYNFGLDDDEYQESLLAFEQLLEMPGIVGDFDGSGELDFPDIDQLSRAVFDAEFSAELDLNEDQLLDFEDQRIWVEELKQSYFGDANLDGEFATSDLVELFQRGEYEDGVVGNSSWETGDWTGDREFGTGDLVRAFQAGGYEQGPRSQAMAVPEPSTFGLLITAFTLFFLRLRSRRT